MRLDIARGRDRQETGKVIIAHGSIEFCQATPICLVDESKESCTGARRTETCVAPRRVDASRDFFISPNEQRGARGLLRRRAKNKEKPTTYLPLDVINATTIITSGGTCETSAINNNNNPPSTDHTKSRLNSILVK